MHTKKQFDNQTFGCWDIKQSRWCIFFYTPCNLILTLGTVYLAMDIVSALLSQTDSQTTSIMTISKLLKHSFDSPICHGYCHHNISYVEYRQWNYSNNDDFEATRPPLGQPKLPKIFSPSYWLKNDTNKVNSQAVRTPLTQLKCHRQ